MREIGGGWGGGGVLVTTNTAEERERDAPLPPGFPQRLPNQLRQLGLETRDLVYSTNTFIM